MSPSKNPPRSVRPSIKYKWEPPKKGSSVEFGELVHEIYAPTVSDENKKSCSRSEPKSHEMLSTAELISSVGKLWDRASHLPIFQSKANLNQNHSVCGEDILANLDREGKGQECLPVDDKCFRINLRSSTQFSPVLRPSFEAVKVTKKMCIFNAHSKDHTPSFFWKLLCGSADSPNGSWKRQGLATIGFSNELGTVYQWMREIIPTGLRYHANFSEAKDKKTVVNCISDDASRCLGGSISADRSIPATNLANGNAEVYSSLIKSKDPPASNDAKLVNNIRETTSLCSDYFLGAVQDCKADNNPISRDCSLSEDYHINILSYSNMYEECQLLADDNELLQNKREGRKWSVTEVDDSLDIHPTMHEKPQYVLAKQEHAFAGALAGIFVSLCLHPVDTVKTVIQSCRAEQRSICYIGRSIVSERGLTGLYRGIASNITSSAPISAVYTFTYESVKGALLPLFPKECHSLAHCIAGGCASVATSFIFTPSERIKQQMQVGTHYNNCWNALVGIVKTGGLHSLYAGWGAVLCRNIPHSIIKFYTYESLKQMMLTPSSTQPNTLQTLVCGGLAGSTAALFTTPFDVVKTRLQTQVPGSLTQYSSVYHALQEIGKHEGLKGLYRGLIPRLVMYMSQGAIFFASYEMFKSLFSLDVPKQTMQHNKKEEDDSTPTPLSSRSRLHGL
ncbi:hypothetical protein SLEP1_g8649 [Rubroshorea leprosula]|uniref:Mitochondrial substrate carrier family protein n=1 Tax=Rubroshorea leprosula TaxID=152421 RepID=A0AAV5I2F2_9ROSI|nr:hypothetical protein SLEP1_g8649 [Rubroshorea leprosula]